MGPRSGCGHDNTLWGEKKARWSHVIDLEAWEKCRGIGRVGKAMAAEVGSGCCWLDGIVENSDTI